MQKLVICSQTNSSVSLFDADRKNEFGERHCIAPLILRSEVDRYWEDYKKQFAARDK